VEALPAAPAALARDLLRWFDDNQRALPWRTDRSPYRVWLSEVMLQQTRVAVVEDYFRRFLLRFPDVESLARASEDEVLSLWSGLGYYSRGRNLHRAARLVVDEHGGRFPATVDGLRALPGVGAYTAAAIASLAFGEPAAVVDGNVARVIARLADDATPVDGGAGRERTRRRAQALVEKSGRPGALNEALMELGALVCTPRAPACAACPWRRPCLARRASTQASLPVKAERKARKALAVASVVVVDADAPGRVWLERRASRGLFGGLHEPPSIEVTRDAAHAWRALLRARGLPVPKRLPPPIVVERTLTHRDLTFSVMHLEVPASRYPGPWVDDVSAIGVSTAVRAVLGVTPAANEPPATTTKPAGSAARGAGSRTRRRAQPSSSPGVRPARSSSSG
jgi:A/G-specific adenine glycosylase